MANDQDDDVNGDITFTIIDGMGSYVLKVDNFVNVDY